MSITIHPLGAGLHIDHAQAAEHCVHTWKVDNQTINLLQIGDQLAYQVSDQGGNWSAEIPRDDKTIEEQLTTLKASEVVLNFDGSVDFLEPELRCPTADNREITLLACGNDLIWQLFDRASRQSSQVVCHLKNELPLEERVRTIKNCTIDQFVALGNQLQSVSLKAIVEPSHLDPDKIVDGDMWAVTLISCGRSQASNPLTWGGHAAILIEGIEEKHLVIKADLRFEEDDSGNPIGSVFMHKLDYFHKGIDLWCKYKDNEGNPCESKVFKRKSETWIKPRSLVFLMINAIEQDKRSKLPCLFNPRGAEAIGINKKFKVNGIGIVREDGDEKLEKMVMLPSKVIHSISDNFPLIGNHWRKKIWPTLFGSKKSAPQLAASITDYNTPTSQKVFASKFVKLVTKHGVDNVSIVAVENCFTWAKKKLLIIHIEIPENPFIEWVNDSFGRIASIPAAFTQK